MDAHLARDGESRPDRQAHKSHARICVLKTTLYPPGTLGDWLPASVSELAAIMNCSSHNANARLQYWKSAGWVVPTDQWIPHDSDKGWKRSRLWEATPLGADRRPGVRIWHPEIWKAFNYGYRCLQARCAEAQWKERHAFTHIGLDEVEMRVAT